MNTTLGIDLPASMDQRIGSAAVVDTIEKGDADGAEKAMRAHLDTVNVTLLNVSTSPHRRRRAEWRPP